MPIMFFYFSIFTVWITFSVVCHFRHPDIRALIIGISAAVYSMVFDCIFGVILGLYYYISPGKSLSYLLIAALFLYPFINIIYTAFLPDSYKSAVYYTSAWIGAMLLFEYISVKSGTIVFTGWQPIPWSVITYIAVFTGLNLLYRSISRESVRRV